MTLSRLGPAAARRTLAAAAAALLLLAACAPRIQERGGAAVAPRLEPGAAVMADGARLPLRAWLPGDRAPAGAVVALHGFNDYSNAFSELGPALAAHGIAVYAYDQRGFGASVEPGIWPGTASLTRDFRTVVRLVRDRHPGVPVHGLGESMGAAVIIAALAEYHRPAIDAAVLSAPALRGREILGPAASTLLDLSARLAPGARLRGENLDVHPSDNIALLRRLARDPLFIKLTRIDAIHGLVGLMDTALESIWALDRLPLLVLYGARDDIVPRDAACRLLARLPAGDATGRGGARSWRVALYPDGYHLLFRDLNGEAVTGDIAAFLADPSGPLPSGHEATARIDAQASNPLPGFCRGDAAGP